MSKFITIGFFAKIDNGWGKKFIPWEEVQRVMPAEMRKALLEFLMGKKKEKLGIPEYIMKEFISKYYNTK